ncbi:hypothetical protein CAPTEDRAFT_208635, partial [Capitella teleta]
MLENKVLLYHTIAHSSALCPNGCGKLGFCLAPNRCSCPYNSGTGTCVAGHCAKNDCFPGQCATNECSCSSGYYGSNCNTILDGPHFDKCKAELMSNVGRNKVETVFSGGCTPKDQKPDNIHWISERDLSAVVMNWEVGHNRPEDIPFVPNFIRRDMQGIISTHAEIHHFDASDIKMGYWTATCNAVSRTNPKLLAECRDITKSYPGTLGLGHRHKLRIQMHSLTGGFKEVNDWRTNILKNVSYDAAIKDYYEFVEVSFDFTKDGCLARGDCYCTPAMGCYEEVQNMFIDNCIIKDLRGHSFTLSYVINNNAGLKTGNSYNIGQINNVRGQDEYPHPSDIAVSQQRGNEVIIKWSNPVACYEIQGVTMFVDGSKRQIDSHEVINEITLNKLQPETDYTFTVRLNYEGDKSSPVYDYVFNSGTCASDTPNCGEDAESKFGLIIGIVVAVLLLLLISLVIGLIVWRYRNNQEVVPRRVRDTMVDIRNRMSRRSPAPYSEEGENGVADANVYSMEYSGVQGKLSVSYVSTNQPHLGFSADEEDIYLYGTSESLKDLWTKSEDRVVIGDTITSGRFAIIKNGELLTSEGKRAVALKMLKSKKLK